MSDGGAELEYEYKDLRDNPRLLKPVLDKLSDRTFPDSRRRLCADPMEQFERHGFAAMRGGPEPVAGSVFLERRQGKRWALLSYIAVYETARREELAHNLFECAVRSACLAAVNDHSMLRAAFALVQDASPGNEAYEVNDELKGIGARRVPVDFEGRESQGRLMLIAFPLDGKPTVELSDVKEVLSHCNAQTSEVPGRDPVDLAPFESSLKFKDFGVVLHFVLPDKDVSGLRENQAPSNDESSNERDPFESFTQDLLSYRYGSDRPPPLHSFISKRFSPKCPETVVLSVPAKIPFHSEGVDRILYLPPSNGSAICRRRRLAVKASCTTFESGHSIYHLALVNAAPASGNEDTFFDEYDVIALSKLWQSGERSRRLGRPDPLRGRDKPDPSEQICVEFDASRGPVTIGEFACRAFDWAEEPVDRVRVGTVQLITDSTSLDSEWTEMWPDIWADVTELIEPAGEDQPANNREPSNENDAALTEETPYKLASRLDRQVRALGGIVQGILDFEAVDKTELTDVFKPHDIDASLLGIHKGTLLCVMESDRSYEAVASTIGISPYLLLPQALLLHNEALLEDVERDYKEAKERGRGNQKKDSFIRKPFLLARKLLSRLGLILPEADKPQAHPRELQKSFNTMRDKLAHYVPNVFQYSQERWLYVEGEATRGLKERRNELAEQARGLETDWRQAVERRRTGAERIRNVLLALIGSFSTIHYVDGLTYRILIICAYLVGLVILDRRAYSWSLSDLTGRLPRKMNR